MPNRPPIESLDGEARLALLVDAVTDYAIFLLSPAGIVLSWNKGAERLKGYKEHEIVGRHFSTFYTEEDSDRDVPQRALERQRRMEIRNGRVARPKRW